MNSVCLDQFFICIIIIVKRQAELKMQELFSWWGEFITNTTTYSDHCCLWG